MPRLWHSRDDANDHSAVGTLRTPDKPRWIGLGQSARLMFLQEAAQLVGLGFEAAGLVLLHVSRLTLAAAAVARMRTAVEGGDGAPAG